MVGGVPLRENLEGGAGADRAAALTGANVLVLGGSSPEDLLPRSNLLVVLFDRPFPLRCAAPPAVDEHELEASLVDNALLDLLDREVGKVSRAEPLRPYGGSDGEEEVVLLLLHLGLAVVGIRGALGNLGELQPGQNFT